MALLSRKDVPQRRELIRKLIALASNDLVEAIYRRVLSDPSAKSWQAIMVQAVQEGVLNEEEAALLLEDLTWEE